MISTCEPKKESIEYGIGIVFRKNGVWKTNRNAGILHQREPVNNRDFLGIVNLTFLSCIWFY